MLSQAARDALVVAVQSLGNPEGPGRFTPLMISQNFTAAEFKTLTGCSDPVIAELHTWMNARSITWQVAV